MEVGYRRHPSVEIRSLHNLIGRYWNTTMPPESIASGGNTPILVYLHKHQNEEVFQYDIEREFAIARSTASRVLSLMEKKGLIRRESVERDARLRKLVLTEEGWQIAESLRANAENLEHILFDGMDKDQQQTLLNGLERMTANLVATGLVGKEHTSSLESKFEGKLDEHMSSCMITPSQDLQN